MRLIDADVLIKQCKPRGIADEVWKESNEYKQIINAPTIDVEPVVRCSECKYVGYDATTFLVCDRKGMGLKPFHVYHDDYCSYGEHREDSEE